MTTKLMAKSAEVSRTVPARLLLRLLVCAVLSSPALAVDKPPLSPDQTAATTAPSKISATIQFSLPALDRALERKVPRRLATFNDRTTSCWHRRILGREINVDCVYSGYVERTAPVSLRAEGGRLSAATPLFGTVSAQGTGRFTSRLHGTAEGQMTVYASARPRLRPDWSVDLELSEGFRWTEPPILRILGFRINLQRYIEPQILRQLERVRGDVYANVRDLDLRGKAELAWQRAFASIKIVDVPEIWLQTTPQAIAFSGVRAHDDVLEGSIEIAGTTETFIGTAPAAPTPSPLPPLGNEVSDPGRFEIIVPVNIGYDLIRQKVQDVLAVRAQSGGPTLREVQIYPSAGKIVAALHLGAAQVDAQDGDWVYLAAIPHVDTGAQTVTFSDLTILTDPASPTPPFVAALMSDSGLLPALQQELRLGYQAELERIMTSASARLTRPLDNGFRSEGHLTSAGVAGVLLLSSGLRIDLRAAGDLRILYGL